MKLIHGECLAEMDILIKQGIKVDAIITDPPYKVITGGVSISGGNAGTKFYFDNYIGTEKLKIIASILWLPLIIVFLFRGGK